MKKRIACLMLALVMLVGLIPVAAVTASAAASGVSESGVRVIKDYMGFHKTAYESSKNVYKIGYGTPAVKGQTITEANADKLLREELTKLAGTVYAKFNSLVQKRFDALVWYSYVEGTGWMSSSEVVGAINSNAAASTLANALCTWDYASVNFPDDNAARGVIQRRMAMANLYLNGGYSASNTGSLGYTVFYAGDDQNAAFPSGAKKMVQVFSGSFNKVTVSEPVQSGAEFLGWYSGGALLTGVGSATAGKTLVAHWQKNGNKVAANYTLPAYVIYEAAGIPDGGTVKVYDDPSTLNKIDEVSRDATVTVVAEMIYGADKWIQLSSGGWVMLCSSLSNVPTIVPATTVTITDDYVNLRKEPSATAAKLGTLKRNSQVTIAMLSSDGKWGYCSQGWIFLAYTSYEKTTTPDSPLTGGISATVIGATQVNVRTAPGVGNPIVTKLNQGTAITVYEQTTVNKAAWGHIDQGWIAMSYVKLNQISDSGSGSSITTGSSAVVSSSVSLNVRSGPGASYTKVATLTPGTSVVILRKETVGGVAWGLIDQGWINLNYVSVTGSSNGSTTGYGVGGTVVNCATGVNIRSAAGTTNALVGVAALGSRVTVTERVKVNGFYWGHIDRGWVCMDYIQLDSEFVDPSESNDGDLDNVVTTFQGYPAITLVATDLRETASVHANSLLTLNAGVTVNILERALSGSNLYGKVTIGTKTGWLKLADVQLQQVNAKVTAAKADAYELPNTRSKFYASLAKGTYVTIGNADGTGWEFSDNALWGQIQMNGSTAWIKLADVTMFKENQMPTGITSLSGVGYMTGYVTGDAVVYQDNNGNVTSTPSAYTLPAYSSVNVLARNYQTGGTTYAKITVGSVKGWIDWSLVKLNPITVQANTTVTTHTTSAVTARNTLYSGERVTIESRYLAYDAAQLNHGVRDIGVGYIGDNTADTVEVVLDDGRLVPTGAATVDDPSNPSVVSSVVVTGTAPAGLSIYEEAINGSRELLKIQAKSNITIINWKNVDNVTWGKVQINKIVGWVRVDDVDFSGLKGIVNVDSLKVYSLPDKASSVQVLRVNNRAIDLSGVTFDGTTVWTAVNVAGVPGYIDIADVKLNTPNMGKDYNYKTVIAKGKINSVNATINLTNGEIQVLPKGTEVELAEIDMTIGKEAMWYVLLGNDAGWINMDCLSMYNTVATVTEASAAIYDDLTLSKTLYTLYRDEKITVVNYKVNTDGRLYGEVVYGNTTGWILLCDELDKMYVSLVPGSTGTTIGGDTNPTNPTTPTEPANSGTAAYIVCSTTVNVRSAAGVSSPLVTTLANGTNVKIYEKTVVMGKEWARIDQGWVCMDYVREGTLANVPNGGNNGNSGTVSIITTVPSGAIAVGYANEDIKIRSGSGMGYPEVGTVKKKNSVVIYESKLDGGMSWGRTDNGWVCVSYLTITGIGAAGSGTAGTIGGVGFTANVRGTASSNGALMAKVMVSSRVVVRETKTVGAETWVRTDLGWINGQYVVMDSTGATTPSDATTTVTEPNTPGDEFVG